jgi:hypothetical protein
VGYTRRVGENGASVSAITGTLSYQRQFTGKTSGTVQITRAINSYVTNVSSEVDTGAAVQVTWRATPRLQLTPGISYLNSKFPQQVSDSGSGRRDRYEVITLDLRYQVLRWLSLHPYGRRDMRSSSEARFGFGANAVGLELLIEEPR